MKRKYSSLLILIVLGSSPSLSIAGSICDSKKVMIDSLTEVMTSSIQAPEPGYMFIISSNYEEIISQAPALDPDFPAFHEGNAFFWHENFVKTFNAIFESISDDLRDVSQEHQRIEMSAKSQGEVIESKKKSIELWKNFKPRNKFDDFYRRLIIEYLSDVLDVTIMSINLDHTCNELKANYSAKQSKATAKKLRKYAKDVKMMIYSPSPSAQDVLSRKALWLALKKISSNLEERINKTPIK